ncbi:lysosomal acid glucosylceramidase-like [Athalia rosae]|uniref:lysosomal acid glucosylceramidase-like n=1 Tax=Athalia rosae TaxID=37344 RepID=UPI000625E150|nr:lysosomal acid glucosylceramidase-like [Athalia rosae]
MREINMRRYLLLVILWICEATTSSPCIHRDFGNGGTVCVCNATYCDTNPEVAVPEIGKFVQYTSSKDGLRLSVTQGAFTDKSDKADQIIEVNPQTTYQSIYGFGGAFTDAAGINIKTLSPGAQENLLRSYFTKEGSNYNLGRLPIGGCDFSTRKYTYDDVANDLRLEHFNLAEEDLVYKIPFMQKALKMNPELNFLAAAWSAPPWMKTNNDYTGFGFLRKEFYQLYADYHMKFLDVYKSYGLEMWAISTGNEPSNGIIPLNGFNSLGWTPNQMGKWIAENLGPTLRNTEHNKTKILALDDQRFSLPWYVNLVFANKVAKDYTDGIAIHWYWDSLPAWVVDRMHIDHPEKFIIMTEASVGDKPWNFKKVVLGSWKRGEQYIEDIIENLEHWVTGWVDWNLALDEKGGPNWKKNFVDSAIIIKADNDEFYKQPMYYAIAHFSKFIPRNSLRIDTTKSSKYIKTVGFRTPDNNSVLVLYNTRSKKRSVSIRDPERGNIYLSLPPKSIHTIVYK